MRRYDDIPLYERQIAETAGFGKPNWYVPAGSNPPALTDWIRTFLSEYFEGAEAPDG